MSRPEASLGPYSPLLRFQSDPLIMSTDLVSPIFVGGTGRSGTTIVARLLGSHAALHMIPIEVRFIVDPGGLCDLVAGKSEFQQFNVSMRGKWWYRERKDGSTRGMYKILDIEVLNGALADLRDSPAASPETARRFAHRLLDPTAAADGARRWVEMTPPNVARGSDLLGIFPDLKLIHVARDGREVACSVAAMSWGPNDPFAALEWWADRMLEAHRACQHLRPDQLLEIRLEDFSSRRDDVLNRLYSFVGETPDQSVRRFLQTRIKGDRAQSQHWKTEVNIDSQADFQRTYERLTGRLVDAGVPIHRWQFD